jgi:hypothetical protein
MQYILDQLEAIKKSLALTEARLAFIEELNNEVSDEEIASMEKSIDSVQVESAMLKSLLEEYKIRRTTKINIKNKINSLTL